MQPPAPAWIKLARRASMSRRCAIWRDSSLSVASGETPPAIRESLGRCKMRKSAKSAPGTPTAPRVVGRQLSIMFESVLLRTLKAPEREKAVACLADLLVQAAGVATR